VKMRSEIKEKFLLWIAQGFGIGRIPFAPGTFGSLLGLLWFALLLLTENFLCFLLIALTGALISVLICEAAEKILKEKDPGSVVLDEIVAIPLCFCSWLLLLKLRDGHLPAPEYFFVQNWPMTVVIFALFRLFDIWKPWPVRQSQSLPGGWGVTVDDLLAAVYVNLVFLLARSCGFQL